MGDVSGDVSYDVDALLERARDAAHLSDFGADDFLTPLRVLCETYARAPFDEQGHKRNQRRLLTLLAARLRVQAALVQHPEIQDRKLSHPMLLTGMPRSGTSALFNLLAADPASRALLLWETQFPDPCEGLAPGEPDPRHEAVKAYYLDAHKKNPEFTKIHYSSADTPEECVLLQALSMHGVHHGVEVMLEPYASWYRDQDLGPMYAYYKMLLQMLDWQRPGDRWLLKAPAHMWAIEAVIENFPDVSIVWSHRDPLLCTASICSMTAAIPGGTLKTDPEQLGPIVMDFYATSLERGLAARDRCETSRFIDVSHDDFIDDSLGVAKNIYDHFDLVLGPEVEAAMNTHVEKNPQGKHGSHDYSLEEWGLDAASVRERFAPYIERFEIETG
jgi:hypothetical protein